MVTTVDEKRRLQSLRSYNILDSLQEKEYDDLTKIASQICQTPISLISLVDEHRQWFKSHIGLDVSETPIEVSFCAHVIRNKHALAVKDAREDERFYQNPLVVGEPHIVFYGGVPLVNDEGHILGTLCVIDHKPRELNQQQLEAMNALSNQIMKLLELRKKTELLDALNKELDAQNTELERFAYVAAHDIKSPLNSIQGLTDLLLSEYEEDSRLKEMLTYIYDSTGKLSQLISDILEQSRNSHILTGQKINIRLTDFFEHLILMADPEKKYTIRYPQTNSVLTFNKTALEQIFLNLISNGIKYNDKEQVQIEIVFTEQEDAYHFSVKDNGMGIAPEELPRLFEAFYVGETVDRFGHKGTGIGLSTVKKMVKALNGEIEVQSEKSRGTVFSFFITK